MTNQPIVEASPKFKAQAKRVVLTIVLFIVFYFLIVALSVVALIASIYGGLALMGIGSIYTILIGVGVIGIGGMFFAFMIKFVFARFRNENPHRIQITEQEQPALFAVIREVANAANTQFPKKVFIIPEVNASVFYNSSFWSMFFPVRKNLQIGLGLLNSLNLSEFKAVLAHEFGHFSQKSMNIGSYVYTANHIIYNLVYDYDQWDKLVDDWRSQGGLWGFFGSLTHAISSTVRWALRGAYNIINTQYLSLSREMEFHADLIAANIAGSQNIIAALRRIEFTDAAYTQTIDFLNTLVDEKLYSQNIYPLHSSLIFKQIQNYQLKSENNLPIISLEDLEKHTNKSRVNYEDQWASHPALAEREESLQQSPPTDYREVESAWTLLQNTESLQKQQTSLLYNLPAEELKEFEKVSREGFLDRYEEQQNKYNIDDRYKGYYGQRYIKRLDVDTLASRSSSKDVIALRFDKLFNEMVTKKAEKLSQDQNDLSVLQNIANREIKTKYFEFDNQKYHRKKSGKIITWLKREIEELEMALDAHDEKIFLFFNANARDPKAYQEQVKKVMADQQNADRLGEYYVNIHKLYIELTNVNYDDEFLRINGELNRLETRIKSFLKSPEGVQLRESLITEPVKETLESYLNQHLTFTQISSFDADSFNNFFQLIQGIYQDTIPVYQLSLKKLTDYQLELIKHI
ncbi:MAG TPA: hypothetical protein DCS93_30945 [Microscillaceae bacterium]|nr:hypothetical protein [Microscillaceae bacterium]